MKGWAASVHAARSRYPDYDAVLQASGLLELLQGTSGWPRNEILRDMIARDPDPAERAYGIALAMAQRRSVSGVVPPKTGIALDVFSGGTAQELRLVFRTGEVRIVSEPAGAFDVYRAARVAPILTAAGDPLSLNESIPFKDHFFRDTGQRDGEGRRIFLEEGGAPERQLVAGPTVAYRAWRVNEGRLASAGGGQTPWPTGRPLEARCVARAEFPTHPWIPAPATACQCGIYALRRREDLDQVVSGARMLCVVGQVALWGHVIEHRLGYRAQYAYPVALWDWRGARIAPPPVPVPPGFPAAGSELEQLAARYGVPWLEGPP